MKSVMHKGFRWLFSKIRDSRLKTKMTLLVLLSVFVPKRNISLAVASSDITGEPNSS